MPNITEALTVGNRRYRAAEKFTPVGVVLHSIGCPQPKAQVLRDAWQRDSSPYVTHYVLDDKVIFHCMPDNYRCWHVGSPGNSKWIGIEMCEPKQIKYTRGAVFTVSNLIEAQEYAAACYNNAVWLIAYLCKKYGWNPQTAIYTHHEVTVKGMSLTDHVDPEHLWNGLGMGYNLYQLRKDVAAMMGKVETKQTESTKPSASTAKAVTVKDWQIAALADGYRFPKYGADGDFGAECEAVAKKAIVKRRLFYTNKNLTKIVQKIVGVTADGLCGKGTDAAIRSYQKKHGLAADGCVGLNTWKKMLGV